MPDPVSMYFTIDEASALVGASCRMLRYWAEESVYQPSHRAGVVFLYTFRDLVALRTIRKLRSLGIPLQHLRKLGVYLGRNFKEPWSSLRFYVDPKKREVQFDDPGTRSRHGSRKPQQAVVKQAYWDFEEVATVLRNDIEKRRTRTASSFGRVTRARGVMGNRDVLEGTRVPTQAVWDFHKAGYSPQQIIEEYPSITVEDVRAAIALEKSKHKVA